MTFEWPMLLWLLLLVPMSAMSWLWLLRSRASLAGRYSGLRIDQGATPGWPRLRRHLPAVLLLMALTLALIGVARPRASAVAGGDRNADQRDILHAELPHDLVGAHARAGGCRAPTQPPPHLLGLAFDRAVGVVGLREQGCHLSPQHVVVAAGLVEERLPLTRRQVHGGVERRL